MIFFIFYFLKKEKETNDFECYQKTKKIIKEEANTSISLVTENDKIKGEKQAMKNEVQLLGAFLTAYFHELPLSPPRKHFSAFGEETLRPQYFSFLRSLQPNTH